MSPESPPSPSPSPRRLWKRALIVGLVALLVLLAVSTIALLTMDRWLFAVLNPGPFDTAATPPAPDYGKPDAWAALPELDDGADVALPESPAIDQQHAPVDVFYVHPTTAVGSSWNAPIDDPVVNEATTRGGTLIQASAFNGCCAVHAPRYRQANGRALTLPDRDGAQAVDVAFADISAAFDHFLARIDGRPFIVAGHSQGSVLAARLIKERIANTPLQARMVAAYLPGAPIRDGSVGSVPICATPTQTGCVASWNARGPAFEPNGFELDANNPETMRGRACVNPISWTTDEAHVPAERSAGAVLFDTDAPKLEPAFADAQCRDGVLIVTQMGELQRDLPSKILLWTMGPENYHPVEYQLYYMDLRRNAIARVEAYLASAG